MTKIYYVVVQSFLFLVCLLQTVTSAFAKPELSYCVPVNEFILAPFTKLDDGKHLAYWNLLFRSYISTASDSPGILESFQFLPDGRTFRAKVGPSAKWADGTRLLPWDAAVGIAKGMRYRGIGESAEVVGSQALETSVDPGNPPPGIRILDHETFELVFDTKVKDFPRVLTDALSTNSRPNRVWPVRLIGPQRGEVLTNYPLIDRSSVIRFKVGDDVVRLVNSKTDCAKSDFSLYADVYPRSTLPKFDIQSAPAGTPLSTSLISANLNTKRLNANMRRILANWLRCAFESKTPEYPFEQRDSFFIDQDPAKRADPTWAKLSASELAELKRHSLQVAFGVPPIKTILETAANKDGLTLRFLATPFTDPTVDVQVLANTFQRNRPAFLQDILSFPWVREFLAEAPLTTAALKHLNLQSSSSLAQADSGFSNLHNAIAHEYAYIPIGITSGIALSRKSAPIRLVRMLHGEFRFVTKTESQRR